MDRSQLDHNRQRLLALIDSHPSYDLAGLSKLLGKNHAYLHQYIWKGSPRVLKDRDWKQLIRALEDRIPPSLAADRIRIPKYSFKAGMGGGQIVLSEDPSGAIELDKTYLDALRLSSKNLIMIEVEGTSMQPTLQSGDQVFIDQDDRNPAGGGVFALRDGDEMLVKRVEKIPASDPPRLKLISDNAHYSPYEVLADDTKILGRIVWYARRI